MTIVTDRIPMPAAGLVVGDRISGTFLPAVRDDGDVVYVGPCTGTCWVLVVYETPDGYKTAEYWRADALIPLTRLGDRGLGYSREPEPAPAPVPVPDGCAGHRFPIRPASPAQGERP